MKLAVGFIIGFSALALGCATVQETRVRGFGVIQTTQWMVTSARVVPRRLAGANRSK